jgi:hypothetical protein
MYSHPLLNALLPYQSKSFELRESTITCISSLPKEKYCGDTKAKPPQFLNWYIPS